MSIRTNELKKKAVLGFGWLSIGNILKQLVQVLLLIVLARMLTPRDFGVYAVIMLFLNFFNTFGSLGTAQFLIRAEKVDNTLFSTVFTVNCLISGLVAVVIFASARWVGEFFSEPELSLYLKLLSIAFFLTGLSFSHNALLEKRLMFDKVFRIELVSVLVSSSVAVLLAAFGAGAFALVAMVILQSVMLSAGFMLASGQKMRLQIDRACLTQFIGFAGRVSLFGLVNYVARNFDQFLIGKLLGSAALGAYAIAYKIMLYPIQNVSRVLLRVLFPVLAKVGSENKKLVAAYLRALQGVAFLSFPLMVLIGVLAELLVSAMFGEGWEVLGPILAILAPVGLMQSITTTIGAIFLTKGKTKLLLNLGTINGVVIVSFVLVGVRYGVTGVALSYAIASFLMFLPSLWIAWNVVGLKLGYGLMRLAPYLIASLIMGITVHSLLGLELLLHLPEIFRLLLLLAVGLCVYLTVMLVAFWRYSGGFIKELNWAKVSNATMDSTS